MKETSVTAIVNDVNRMRDKEQVEYFTILKCNFKQFFCKLFKIERKQVAVPVWP